MHLVDIPSQKHKTAIECADKAYDPGHLEAPRIELSFWTFVVTIKFRPKGACLS